MTTSKYHVFLSHKSADKPAVEELAHRLRAIGLEPWLDKWNLVPGEAWQPALEEALRDSATCVVFVGPSGFGDWQHEEMRAAIARRVGSQHGPEQFRVIPVLLPGAVRGDRSKLPEFLTATTWVEFPKSLDDANFRRLERAIRGLPTGPDQPISEIECPYRGLEVFDVEHAPLFFGRAAVTDWLLSALRGTLSAQGPTRFLAIVGASGSGKSSLARAGLLAALKNGGIEGSAEWLMTICRPGPNPLESLADALAKTEGVNLGRGLAADLMQDLQESLRARPTTLHQTTRASLGDSQPNRRLVILVDQFEELFTVCKDDVDRKGLIDNLLYAARIPQGQTIVLLTMRADFYGKCAFHLELSAMVSEHQYLVGPLTANELREVIERPAQRLGCELEPGLVELLVEDVQKQPGALPLLQFGLMRMWTTRTGRRLTIADYQAIGQLDGIIEKRAEEVFQGFTEHQQELCRRLFLRLTEPGEGTEDTKRRVHWSELENEADSMSAVVKSLADERMLTTSAVAPADGKAVLAADSIVEVAHETLIRKWQRLRDWIEADRTGLSIHHRLTEAAAEWEQNHRDPGLLDHGTRLAVCKEWADKHAQELSPLEQQFLSASLQREQTELDQARQSAERFRRLAIGLAAVVIIACGLAGFAWRQTTMARTAEESARRVGDIALRDIADYDWRSAASARESDNPLKASHLFLKGAASIFQIEGSRRTSLDKNQLATAGLAAHDSNRTIFQCWVHDASVTGAQFSRDESRVLTWSSDKTARLWDVTNPEPIQTFKHDREVNGAQFSQDESRVLTWSGDKTARLWDVTKPEPIQTFKHDREVNGALFSRDESRVLTLSADSTARLWDVTNPKPVQTFKHDGGIVNGAQFSRDESHVLTWGFDKTARLWDVTKPQPIQTFKHDSFVDGAQFSRDGSHVLTWSQDTTARLWDATKPEPIQTFNHDNSVLGAQFSRDGSHVLTWSQDTTARLWDATKPEPIKTFKHDSYVNGAQFSRDESRVLTWSGDKTARLWDVTKPEPIQTFKHENSVNAAQFSQDELRVLTWSADKTARLWDVTKPEPIRTFQHEHSINGAQFSRDESRVLTWSEDHTARLWDVTKPEPIQTFKHGWFVTGVQFSRDELRVLSWSQDHTARLWDVTKPEPIQTFKHNAEVNGAQFSRDESRVLTWSNDKTARLWDVTKSEPIRTFKHDSYVDGAQFSRDASHVLTWSRENTARLWDVTKSEPIRTFQHDSYVDGAQFSRDASHVLTWSYDKTARLWDVTKPEPIQTYKHEDIVLGAQFGRDESRVLTWSDDKTARLWDVTKPEPHQTFKHDDKLIGAQFSRDEARVLTWSGDNTAHLWDLTNPVPIQTFKHDSFVIGAKFSRDELRLLTWSDDNTARLWDVTKPDPIQTFEHNHWVTDAQFSRDESRVLTSCYDKTSRMWDVTKPEPIQTFKHDDVVYGAQFNRDESRVLSWSRDKTARLWDVTDPLAELTPPQRQLELKVRTGTTLDQNLNLRTLTHKEWQDLATSEEYRGIQKKLPRRTPSAIPAQTAP